MPSSFSAGGAGVRPEEEGAAPGAPLLRLPTSPPDKGAGGAEGDAQSKERRGICRCREDKEAPSADEEERRADEEVAAVAGPCPRCGRVGRRGAGDDSSEPTTPGGGRVRPVITFSHVEGGGTRRSCEGRDSRSRSPSPLLEIPTPVDTSKEIMRPPTPTAERT